MRKIDKAYYEGFCTALSMLIESAVNIDRLEGVNLAELREFINDNPHYSHLMFLAEEY